MSASLGRSEKSEIKIDVPRLIETRMLVQASSGGGKSYAVRRILEQTCKEVQQIVIDPEGEFATLREKHDYVIGAARGGDVMAHPKTAALLARRLLETGVSAVLDIYELKAYERVSFVKLFLDALVNAPKELWHPVLVVVDEAHVFCPEKGHAESSGAVIDLATRGRKRGFCSILATQRLSKLHKDAAAEMFNKLIGRTGLDVDVKRAADELGFGSREATAILRDLEPGEFFAFGPALSRQVVKVTVGAVATTHPKVGERSLIAPPTASPKIRKVLAELADLPKEAEEEAKTLAELRAENAALKRELKKVPVPPIPAKPAVKMIEVPVLKDSQIKALGNFVNRIQAAGQGFTEIGREIAAAMAKVSKPGPVPMPKKDFPVEKPVTAPKMETPKYCGTDSARSLGKAERAILNVLAQRYPNKTTRSQASILSGYSATSSSFANALGFLRSRGFILGAGDALLATEDGLNQVGEIEPIPTGVALVAYWRDKLGKAERVILQALVDAYPAHLSKEQVSEASGYSLTSSSLANALGKLRTLELIEGRGEIRASEVFFES